MRDYDEIAEAIEQMIDCIDTAIMAGTHVDDALMAAYVRLCASVGYRPLPRHDRDVAEVEA